MRLLQLDVAVAESFQVRLRGLSWRDPEDLEPLLLPRCRSLHTFGMRAAIDVVWLDLGTHSAAEVLAVDLAVPPRRLRRAPHGAPRGRTAALELPAGEARRLALQPGVRVTLRFDAEGWEPNAARRGGRRPSSRSAD